MKLKEKLNTVRKDFQAKAPKDAVEIVHKATEHLNNSGILDRALKVGNNAPDFSLQDGTGRSTRLKDLLSQSPVVLSFYRGRW